MRDGEGYRKLRPRRIYQRCCCRHCAEKSADLFASVVYGKIEQSTEERIYKDCLLYKIKRKIRCWRKISNDPPGAKTSCSSVNLWGTVFVKVS